MPSGDCLLLFILQAAMVEPRNASHTARASRSLHSEVRMQSLLIKLHKRGWQSRQFQSLMCFFAWQALALQGPSLEFPFCNLSSSMLEMRRALATVKVQLACTLRALRLCLAVVLPDRSEQEATSPPCAPAMQAYDGSPITCSTLCRGNFCSNSSNICRLTRQDGQCRDKGSLALRRNIFHELIVSVTSRQPCHRHKCPRARGKKRETAKDRLTERERERVSDRTKDGNGERRLFERAE